MIETVTRMNIREQRTRSGGFPQGLTILGGYLAFKAAIVIASVIVIAWYPSDTAPLITRAWWGMLGADGVLILMMSAFIPKALGRQGLKISDLGYKSRWTPRDIAWGLGAGAAIWLVHHSLLEWVSRAAGQGWVNIGMKSGAAAVRSGGPAAVFGAWLSAVVLSPILEETVYRACLITSLLRRWGGGASKEAAYVLASALIFALGHHLSHPLYTAVYAVTGAGLAIVYLRTRSLNAVIVAHALINAIVQFRSFSPGLFK